MQRSQDTQLGLTKNIFLIVLKNVIQQTSVFFLISQRGQKLDLSNSVYGQKVTEWFFFLDEFFCGDINKTQNAIQLFAAFPTNVF